MYIQTKIQEFKQEAPTDELGIMARFHEECKIFGNTLYYKYDYVFRCYVRKEGF